jgi:hypothetical protein
MFNNKKIMIDFSNLKKKERRVLNRFLSINTILRLITDKREKIRSVILKNLMCKLRNLTPKENITPNTQKEIFSINFRIYDKTRKIYIDINFDTWSIVSLKVVAYETLDLKCKHTSNLNTIGDKIFKR